MRKKQFRFFAYNPPTDGTFTVNGYTYKSGEDFRNIQRCKEYKNCGFDMIQLRYGHAYNGEPWETSATKYMWDKAYAAGITKMLVTDLRIEKLIRPKRGIVSDVCEKYTDEELDALLTEWTAPYSKEKGFYGIQLLDEPAFEDLPAYGAVARSLRRILPNAYLQMNLHPLGTVKVDGAKDVKESYEIYANKALEYTGLSNICFDEYPFRREYIISGNTLRNYQVMARVCKERGVEMQAVLQSFSNAGQKKYLKRKVIESDMYWQTNLAMGFGVREYSFYTYMPKPNVSYEIGGGDGIDGACFINNDGSKSALYTYTKRIIREMKKFSKIALKYDYEDNYLVTETGKTVKDFDQTAFAETNEKLPFPISVNHGVALITEQRKGNARLFMIENIGNVKEELFDGVAPMLADCVLPQGEKRFYYRGERVEFEEVNGKYRFPLKVGDAVFVEIIKE